MTQDLMDDPNVARYARGGKGRAARSKGRRGEKEARAMLERAFGRIARINYGQAAVGGEDITFPLVNGLPQLRIEVKRRASAAQGATIRQALDQLAKVVDEGDVGVVLSRSDNEPWYATVPAEVLLAWLAELELYRGL